MRSQEEIIEYIQKEEKELRTTCEELHNETRCMVLKERFNAMHGLMEDMLENLEIPKMD